MRLIGWQSFSAPICIESKFLGNCDISDEMRVAMKSYASDRLGATLASFLVVFGMVLTGGSAIAQLVIDYPRDRATVVVSFMEVPGEIKDQDPGPSLRIHGDGYVIVHYPRYMKRAGDYALQLSPQEMEDLMRSLIDHKKILEFDETAARRSKRDSAIALQEGSRSNLSAVLDASVTVIDLRVNRYKPAGGNGQEILNVDKKILWHGLRSDARQYPEIEAIQSLAAVQQELLALMQRQDLKKIQ